jgi:hypothetical protein
MATAGLLAAPLAAAPSVYPLVPASPRTADENMPARVVELDA